jgi:hypothetical protein
MLLAYEARLQPGTANPKMPERSPQSGLNVSVVFTSVESALAALRMAGALADRLNGRVTLLVPQVVPYPLPLASPPVLIDWNERRFRRIADGCPVSTSVEVYLCRDRLETLKRILPTGSVVVVGGARRWWPTAETRLAAGLLRAGHAVIFAEGKHK